MDEWRLVVAELNANDEEPHGAIPKEARVGADQEEQHGVEPVVEHPWEAVVLADVIDDPEQREAALVGVE